MSTEVGMPMFYNRHYIILDDKGRITDGWSDGPHPDRDATDAICIDTQGKYQFRMLVFRAAQSADGLCDESYHVETEENPPLYTMDGIPIYEYLADKEEIVERTSEEIDADRAAIPAPPPSPQEQMRADIDFIAAIQWLSL